MIVISFIVVIVGFFLLIKGADILVDGASGIAKKMKVPEFVIGLTIVSIGTSVPELFISLTSTLKGYQDITIGNVVGSNIANLLLILGATAIIKTIDIKKGALLFEIPICLLITLLFALMCIVGKDITTLEASMLLGLFIAFVIYTIVVTKINKKNNLDETKDEIDSKSNNILTDIFYITMGIIALKYGGDLSVNNAVNIAKFYGISEKIISVTLLAIGTSLPELVTSVVSAIRGNSDIAVGNVLGSNLFNLLLIVGTTGLIKPIIYNTTYNFDMAIMIVATALFFIFPFIPPKNKMSRIEGIIYVALYIAYIVTAMYS